VDIIVDSPLERAKKIVNFFFFFFFFNRATYQGKEKKWLAQIFIHFGMMLKR
jgi:hypothetical protein